MPVSPDRKGLNALYEKRTYCSEPRAKEVELLVLVPFWSRAVISGASVPIYILQFRNMAQSVTFSIFPTLSF